jgi:hypothetical protein
LRVLITTAEGEHELSDAKFDGPDAVTGIEEGGGSRVRLDLSHGYRRAVLLEDEHGFTHAGHVRWRARRKKHTARSGRSQGKLGTPHQSHRAAM